MTDEEKDAGCVKDETVYKMKKYVACISCLEIVVSLGLLAYGSAVFFGVDKKVEAGGYDTKLKLDSNSFLGPLILVTGLIGMVIGGTGLAASKKGGIWACIYVIGSLFVALICLIIGGVVLGGETAAQFKEMVCDNVYNGKKGSEIAQAQMALIEDYMCSAQCPCPLEAQAKYTTLWGTADGKLRFKAAKRYFINDAPAGIDGTYKPLVFTATGTTYKQYSKCYTETLEKNVFTKDGTDQKYKDAYADFKNDGLAYFQQMEKEYKCGGVCNPSLFYVDLPVTDGPPTMDCISAVTSEENWKNNYGVGAVAFIAAIVLILAAIFGIPLCKGFNKKQKGGCCSGDPDDEMNKDYA